MKNLLKKFLTSAVILILFLSFTNSVEAEKKVVAVMPLENVSGYNEYRVAEIMTENLMVEIQNSGNYIVAERTQMGTILKEQGFQNLTSSNPVEMGEMSGADYSVVGKVTLAVVTTDPTAGIVGLILNQIGGSENPLLGKASEYIDNLKAKVEMDVRFVDNKTGEIIFARTFEGSKSGKDPQLALNGACKVASQNFLREMQSMNPFAARVLEISGNQIYIDKGAESGLRKGEILNVVREGSPIVVNEKIVGMKSNSICKITVIEVNSDYSICKAESASLPIRKGDIVKRG